MDLSLKPLRYYNPIKLEWCIEEFRTVKNWEGIYCISDCGRAKSLARTYKGRGDSLHTIKERILKPTLCGDGYLLVIFCRLFERKGMKISTLVWDTFGNVPRDGRKLQVDHVDGNKLNNYFYNLQLLTSRENVTKAYFQSGTKYPTGVSWHKQHNKYYSQIWDGKKNVFLGLHRTIEEASNAYQEALNNLIPVSKAE